MKRPEGEDVPVDLAALARESAGHGPIWAYQGTDLNVTVLRFADDAGVAEHTNGEVDVLLVGLEGEGVVEIDGTAYAFGEGKTIIIPKGRTRAIRSAGAPFVYLSCHRRRAGLWPRGVPRPDEQRTGEQLQRDGERAKPDPQAGTP